MHNILAVIRERNTLYHVFFLTLNLDQIGGNSQSASHIHIAGKTDGCL